MQSSSKKSKTVDIREFLLRQNAKKRKSQCDSCSTPNIPPTNESANLSHSSPSINTSQAHETSQTHETPQSHETPKSHETPQTQETPQTHETPSTHDSPQSSLNERHFDVNILPHDPAKRKNIMDYHPNDRDVVRRAYMQRGPCQPRSHDFPQRECGKDVWRRFRKEWFDKYPWIEYSVENDAAYCFFCYLFKCEARYSGQGDSFVHGGFRSWNKSGERFSSHVGGPTSAHSQSLQKCDALMNQKASISTAFYKQSEQVKSQYRARLCASLHCLRWLLRLGLPTRGHDEKQQSLHRGLFFELLEFHAEYNDNVGSVVLKNAPKNCQMTSPKIQKDLIKCCAKETTRLIIEELGDDFFSILADESGDISHKEQMGLCLRYVHKEGHIVERFLGIVHVGDTSALTLKAAIYSLLAEHSLSPSRIRGQGYDGANNMKGELNGLKTLIMKDSPCAYFIHCFAHQLQLTLVGVAKKNSDCNWLFDTLNNLLNVVGGSCKRAEILNDEQASLFVSELEAGEVETGTGLNQELGLGRPGDTRWGSHHKTIVNVLALYPAVIQTLMVIGKQVPHLDDRIKAETITFMVESYHFVFMLHLMVKIFGLTNALSQALQKKDQDIINAVSLICLTKQQLQVMRLSGWDELLGKVTAFCIKHGVQQVNMDDPYVPHGRSRRFSSDKTFLHHFKYDVFNEVIDLQLQELNSRFDEINMELLVCMTCLNPIDSFSSYDKQKLVRLAEFYPSEFSSVELVNLEYQLDNFVADMRTDERFGGLMNINDLSKKLVETKKHMLYQQVYLLLKLIMILPVATASVERAFSAMKIVTSSLRNSMGDELLNDNLVTFIEREIFLQISDEVIITRFQNMKTRRQQL